MTEADKKLWIAALRSGKIEQGKGRLEDYKGAMCCLGVVCSLIIPERKLVLSGGPCYRDSNRFGHDAMYLPFDIAGRLGISRQGTLPFLDKNGEVITLAGCNDLGLSFSQIADLIEFFF